MAAPHASLSNNVQAPFPGPYGGTAFNLAIRPLPPISLFRTPMDTLCTDNHGRMGQFRKRGIARQVTESNGRNQARHDFGEVEKIAVSGQDRTVRARSMDTNFLAIWGHCGSWRSDRLSGFRHGNYCIIATERRLAGGAATAAKMTIPQQRASANLPEDSWKEGKTTGEAER